MTNRFRRSFSPAAVAALNAYADSALADGRYAHLRGLAGAIRAVAEELQYKLFLAGNDLSVVEANALFKLANELEKDDDQIR